MDKRTRFTLAAVAATVFATLAALTPLSRALSKVNHELYGMTRQLFLEQSLGALAVGILFIVIAAFLTERHRLVAALLLMLAPIAALATGVAL